MSNKAYISHNAAQSFRWTHALQYLLHVGSDRSHAEISQAEEQHPMAINVYN